MSYKHLRRKWWAVLKGSTPWRSTNQEIAGCSGGLASEPHKLRVVGSNPTPALRLKDMMISFLKYIVLISIVTGVLFIYNTIVERNQRRKEIEKLNKQLEKYGKKPISFK